MHVPSLILLLLTFFYHLYSNITCYLSGDAFGTNYSYIADVAYRRNQRSRRLNKYVTKLSNLLQSIRHCNGRQALSLLRLNRSLSLPLLLIVIIFVGWLRSIHRPCAGISQAFSLLLTQPLAQLSPPLPPIFSPTSDSHLLLLTRRPWLLRASLTFPDLRSPPPPLRHLRYTRSGA